MLWLWSSYRVCQAAMFRLLRCPSLNLFPLRDIFPVPTDVSVRGCTVFEVNRGIALGSCDMLRPE